MSLPGGHKDALSGCTRLLRIVVLLSEMYLIACGAKCFVRASHRASYEVRSEITVLWYTYSKSPVSEIYRFWEVFTYHTLRYSSSCFYILCRLDMDRKRCFVSRELLSYKSLFCGINPFMGSAQLTMSHPLGGGFSYFNSFSTQAPAGNISIFIVILPV